MDSTFLSAGRFYFSRQFFFLLFVLVSSLSCRPEKEDRDSQITELQKDVKQLSEENRQLLREVQRLREEMKPPQTESTTPAKTITKVADEMTLQRMKREVEPLLKEIIDTIKQTTETPRKDRQYGMRIEYDLKNAVFGLMNVQDGFVPSAKVIVKYEKFLESATDSRSIGEGSSSFLFSYQNDRWVLQSYE